MRKKAKMSQIARNEKGFSLIEVMIAAGSALVLALALAVVQSGRSRGNQLLNAGASNTSLSEALRMQLSRRETCLSSLTQGPTSYSGQSEIAVRLGNTASSDVVVAGANLKNWKVRIASLNAKNFSAYGNLSNGNAVFIGDVYLRSESPQLDTGAKMQFKEVLVSRLAFEVNGGNLAACYADDASTDSMQQLEQVCNLTISSDGTPATWSGGRCVIPDNSTYTTCQSLGGNWNGTSCSFSMTTTVISKNFNDGDNVNNNLTCPSGYITGGACAWYGNPTQIGTMYIGSEGTLFSCSGANWSVGNTYRISAVCAQ